MSKRWRSWPNPGERSKLRAAALVNGAALLDLIPDRLRLQFQPLSRVADTAVAGPAVLLTGTQATVHNALIAALLNSSAPIVLQGGAGVGKTTVLTAALSCISDPSVQVIRLDGTARGMDESYRRLFTKRRHGLRWHDAPERPPERRIVLVADQAESMHAGTFAYLDLLARMPGKEALLQMLIVGREVCWASIDGMVAERLLQAMPIHLTLSALSEQDAWELFYRRVSSVHPLRSTRRVVTTLLERSGGLPGRFDQVLQAAVASGLLQGASSQTA